MYTVVFEEVTYYNSDIMTVQAFGHVELGSSGPINFGPDTTFNMTQSSFSSDTGTALELYVAKAYISNSTFNTGRTQRGLYAQYVTLTVESSTFSNFRVAGVSSNLTMINCTFSNLNTGSAISMDHVNYLKLHNSTVFNNHASSGGGISFVGILLMITGCTFKSNTATLKGGAIYASVYYLNNSIISLNNSFLNNSATDGGAIYLDYSLNLITRNSTVYSTDDVFEGNSASNSGGAVYSNISSPNAVFSVRNSVFHNNVAAGERAGAIFSAGLNVSLLIVGSTFVSNSAPSCGVMEASNHVAVDFDSSSFIGNVATGQLIGGGVACVRNVSVSIQNSTFTYNRAIVHAGVLYVDNSLVSIWDSTFFSNSAAIKGGVIYTQIVASSYSIMHSAFSHNSAGESGGVMYLNKKGSQATITGSIISFNRAANRGGAFSIISSSLNITGSDIYNNTADKGNTISACNSTVLVEGLSSSVDSTQPICNLYEGSVNTFNIVPPHDLDSLATSSPPTSTPPPSTPPPSTPPPSTPPPGTPPPGTPPPSTPPPTSTPKTTDSEQPTTQDYTPNTSSQQPTQDHGTSPSSTPSDTLTEHPTQNRYCVEKHEQNKRLTALVYTFAAIIVVLVVCLIALTTKVIFDCVRARRHKYQQLQSEVSLEAITTTGQVGVSVDSYQPSEKNTSVKTPSTDSD